MCGNIWRHYRCGHSMLAGFTPCAHSFELKEQYDFMREKMLPVDTVKYLKNHEGSSYENPVTVGEVDGLISDGDMGPYLCARVQQDKIESSDAPDLDFLSEDFEKVGALCEDCEKSLGSIGFTEDSFRKAENQMGVLIERDTGHSSSSSADISTAKTPKTPKMPLYATYGRDLAPKLPPGALPATRALKNVTKQSQILLKAKQQLQTSSRTSRASMKLKRTYEDAIDDPRRQKAPRLDYNNLLIARHHVSTQTPCGFLDNQISMYNIAEEAPAEASHASSDLLIDGSGQFQPSGASSVISQPTNAPLNDSDGTIDPRALHDPEVAGMFDLDLDTTSMFADNVLSVNVRDFIDYGPATARSLAMAQQEAEEDVAVHGITQSIKSGFIDYEKEKAEQPAAEGDGFDDSLFARLLQDYNASENNMEVVFGLKEP